MFGRFFNVMKTWWGSPPEKLESNSLFRTTLVGDAGYLDLAPPSPPKSNPWTRHLGELVLIRETIGSRNYFHECELLDYDEAHGTLRVKIPGTHLSYIMHTRDCVFNGLLHNNR